MCVRKPVKLGLCIILSPICSHIVCAITIAQSCLTPHDTMGGSPPGSSVLGILQQEYWNGLSFPPPEDLPDPGIERTLVPCHLHWQADSLSLCYLGNHTSILFRHTYTKIYNWKCYHWVFYCNALFLGLGTDSSSMFQLNASNVENSLFQGLMSPSSVAFSHFLLSDWILTRVSGAAGGTCVALSVWLLLAPTHSKYKLPLGIWDHWSSNFS